MFTIKRTANLPMVASLASKNAHTFPWGDMMTAVIADPTQYAVIDVPADYWKDRKEQDGKNTAAHRRDRIVLHFNDWRKDEKAPSAEQRGLFMIKTKPNEEDGSVEVFMHYNPAKAPDEAAKLKAEAPEGADDETNTDKAA